MLGTSRGRADCTLTAGGDELPSTVTIATVEGGDHTISVDVAQVWDSSRRAAQVAGILDACRASRS